MLTLILEKFFKKVLKIYYKIGENFLGIF